MKNVEFIMNESSSMILLLLHNSNNINNKNNYNYNNNKLNNNNNNNNRLDATTTMTMTNVTISLYQSFIQDNNEVNVFAAASTIINNNNINNNINDNNNNNNSNSNNNSNNQNIFYGELFQRLNHEYRSIHGYLSLVVCVFGIIANVLNIIVLTRKNMESPTNTILTGVAVSDLLVIASFLPYVIHNYIRTEVPEEQMYNYGWAVFTLFHAHNTVLFHTISIWLTVLLAVWRFFTVRTPLRTRSMLTIGRARLYILLVYLIVPIFCIPVFITFTIHPIPVMTNNNNHHKNISIYTVDTVKLEGKHPDLLEKITFWVFSVFLKLIPCLLLTCITLALIRILIDAKKRKERLLKGHTALTNLKTTNNQQPKVVINISSSNNQTTSLSQSTTITNTIIDSKNKHKHHHHHRKHHHRNHHHRNNQQYQQQQQQQTESSVTEIWKFGRVCRDCTLFIIRKFTTTNTTMPSESSSSSTSSSSLQSSTSSSSSSLYVSITPNQQQQQQDQLKLKSPRPQILQPHQPSLHSSSSNSERTTRMLIAVLIMFLVCEFPSGILALLSGILGKSFFKNVYNNFGDLMDMLALINSAVNFVLYCLMSQQFRKTFSQLFCIRWTTTINHNNNNTNTNINTLHPHHQHNQSSNSCIVTSSQQQQQQQQRSNCDSDTNDLQMNTSQNDNQNKSNEINDSTTNTGSLLVKTTTTSV